MLYLFSVKHTLLRYETTMKQLVHQVIIMTSEDKEVKYFSRELEMKTRKIPTNHKIKNKSMF
jgi:hypothetical protein